MPERLKCPVATPGCEEHMREMDLGRFVLLRLRGGVHHPPVSQPSPRDVYTEGEAHLPRGRTQPDVCSPSGGGGERGADLHLRRGHRARHADKPLRKFRVHTRRYEELRGDRPHVFKRDEVRSRRRPDDAGQVSKHIGDPEEDNHEVPPVLLCPSPSSTLLAPPSPLGTLLQSVVKREAPLALIPACVIQGTYFGWRSDPTAELLCGY